MSGASGAADAGEQRDELDRWRPSVLLGRVRTDSRYHWLALVSACVVGLVLATVHWSGIVIGGALVGVLAANLRRAVLSGFGFGILVVLVWTVRIALPGSLGAVTTMGEFGLLPAGIAVGLAVLGSLFRGALA